MDNRPPLPSCSSPSAKSQSIAFPETAALTTILGDLAASKIVANTEFVPTALALLQMASRVQSATETHFQRLGLSQGRYSVLQLLFTFGDRRWTPALLAESLAVTRATMTDLLKILERDGWLLREAVPEDGRVARIALSEKGRRRFRNLMPRHFQSMARVFAGWSRRDHEEARRLASRVGRLFSEYQNSLMSRDVQSHRKAKP